MTGNAMTPDLRRTGSAGGVLAVVVAGLVALLGFSMTASAAPDDVAVEARELWQDRPARVIGLEVVEYDDEGRPEITHVDWVFSETRVRRVIEEFDGEINWAVPMHALTPAEDPLIGQQWALPVIDAATAWPSADGTGIVVAVVDTGVADDHPDLIGQLVTGRNIINGTDDPYDYHGHGTHVAGIIAASTNNGVGVAGAAPGARIMPVQVLSRTGAGTSSHVAQGIRWAVDNGADIINLSLGGGWSLAISDAVRYAVDNDVVVVAAAGNDGQKGNTASWPAADPNTLAVASVDPSLATSVFSTRGSYVDISAPGRSILSTHLNNSYANLSGTSMSAPYASAIAAALRQLEPDLTEHQVRDRLKTTAIDLPPVGKDTATGHGLVTFPAALGLVEAWSSPEPSALTSAVDYRDVIVSASTPSADHLLGIRLERGGEMVALANAPSLTDRDNALIAGDHIYTVRAISTSGTLGPEATLTVTIAPPPIPVITATASGQTVTVTMASNTDVDRWFIYRDGVLIESTPNASTQVILTQQPTHARTYTVRAGSNSGTSAFSNSVTLGDSTTTTTAPPPPTTTTPPPPTTAPPPDTPTAPGDGFSGLTPARLADTRPGGRTIDNTGPTQTLTANTITGIKVTGRGGVPTNATATALNVTVTNPTHDGYLTVYPCGTNPPDASNLNYTAGQTIPNAVITQIGTNGRICVYTNQTTDIIIDVNGHFSRS